MTKGAPIAWITSFGLHGLLIILALLTWKATPLMNDSPSISVDIIAQTASNIGPAEEISNDEAVNDTQKIISEPPAPATEQLAPEPEIKPIVKPAPKIAPPPMPPPTPLPQKTLKPAPKAAPAPTPKAAPKTPPTQQTKVLPAVPAPKKSKGEESPLFDLAAATRAASGVNSGGRAAPKLSNSKTAPRGANAGGGARLQGDLANALRNQVKNCWYEPADLSDPAHLIVELQMELGTDGNLLRAPRRIKPTTIAADDTSLKIAADNAQRAARQCAPYDLPANQYNEWRSFIFRFDPREMRLP